MLTDVLFSLALGLVSVPLLIGIGYLLAYVWDVTP